MKTRIILLIAAILLVLGFAVMAGATSSGDNGTSSDNDSIVLQDDADDSSGDEGTEDGDDSDSDDEEPAEEEGTEEAPSEETPEGVGMGDFLATSGMEAPTVDTNLQDALGGYADYEVQYDTTVSHADNTPSELRALGEEYLERTDPASEAGKVALALAD
ncbi:hypothetical protein KAU08_05850, partial [bacterium]|nr:hypothetical protein [bacterium]